VLERKYALDKNPLFRLTDKGIASSAAGASIYRIGVARLMVFPVHSRSGRLTRCRGSPDLLLTGARPDSHHTRQTDIDYSNVGLFVSRNANAIDTVACFHYLVAVQCERH
jgi:hypothetical protein